MRYWSSNYDGRYTDVFLRRIMLLSTRTKIARQKFRGMKRRSVFNPRFVTRDTRKRANVRIWKSELKMTRERRLPAIFKFFDEDRFFLGETSFKRGIRF